MFWNRREREITPEQQGTWLVSDIQHKPSRLSLVTRSPVSLKALAQYWWAVTVCSLSCISFWRIILSLHRSSSSTVLIAAMDIVTAPDAAVASSNFSLSICYFYIIFKVLKDCWRKCSIRSSGFWGGHYPWQLSTIQADQLTHPREEESQDNSCPNAAWIYGCSWLMTSPENEMAKWDSKIRLLHRQNLFQTRVKQDVERWTLCLLHWCMVRRHSHCWWTVFTWCPTFNMKLPVILSSPSCCCRLHSSRSLKNALNFHVCI